MSLSTHYELQESIKSLSNYKARLLDEIANVAKKLRIAKTDSEKSLKENDEILKIESLTKNLQEKIKEVWLSIIKNK